MFPIITYSQDISAFDKALQVIMAAFVLAELLVTAFAVSDHASGTCMCGMVDMHCCVCL